MKRTVCACVLMTVLLAGAGPVPAQVSNIQMGSWYAVPGAAGTNTVTVEFSAHFAQWDWAVWVGAIYWTNPVNATRSPHRDGFRVWGEPEPGHPGQKSFLIQLAEVPATAEWHINGTFVGPIGPPGILPWSFSGTGGGYHRLVPETVEILATCLTARGEQWTKRRRFHDGNWITEERPCPDTCDDCPGCPPGTLSTRLDGLRVQVGLGGAGFGQSAGQLELQAATPAPELSTPAALRLRYPEQAEPITNQTGQLRQVLAPQALADILTTSPYEYQIHLYPRAVVGPKSNGLYSVTGPPAKTISIANPDASPELFNRLLITQTEQGQSRLSQYLWTESLQQWDLASGNGLRHQSRTSTWDPTGTNRTDLILLQDSQGQLLAKTRESWRVFAWGTNLVQRVRDPDTTARTERFTYYDNPATDGPNYSRLRLLEHPDGYWERYSYDNHGRIIQTVAPVANTGPDSPAAEARVTTTEYGPFHETVLVRVQGQEIARTYRAHGSGLTVTEQCRSNGAPWQAASSLVSTTRWHTSGPFSNLTSQLHHPNGTLELASYALAANGATRTSTNDFGAPNPSATAITNGIRTIRTLDQAGQLQAEQILDIASGLTLASQRVLTNDTHGRALLTASLAGTNQSEYGCCGLLWQRNPEGILTSYTHDQLQRLATVTRAGITTSNQLDAAGQLIAQFRNGTRVLSNTFNLAGELTASTDPRGFTTLYQLELSPQGESIHTTRYPDGSTLVETWYRDRQLKSRTGSAVQPVRFEYGVELIEGQPHLFTREIKLTNAGTDSAEWTTTYTDMLGQTVRVMQADGSQHRRFFNGQGQLWKEQDPDGRVTLYAYNDRGELVTTARDLNRNDQIDLAGPDRILTTESAVRRQDDLTVQELTTRVHPDADSTASVIVKQTAISTDGRQAWQVSFGLTNQSAISIDHPAARKTVTRILADGSRRIDTYQDGRLQQQIEQDSTGLVLSRVSCQYDGDGRLIVTEDAFGGPTLHQYNAADQLIGRVQAGQTNRWDYDSRGRVVTNHLPNATILCSEYYPSGQLKEQSGSGTQPTQYTYDYAGRLQSLTTWQDQAGDRGRATTTWSYHPQNGRLTSRVHPDQAAVSYQYTPGGRLTERRWARGITTSYTYNNAGELTAVDYSDATADLAYTHDRQGRLVTVTQVSGLGTNSALAYAYNAAGQLLTETWTAGPLAGITVSNSYDSLRRRRQLAVVNGPEPVGHPIGFEYDSASRLAVVGQDTLSAAYTYHAHAPGLVSNLILRVGGANHLVTSKTYDTLNRLTEVRTQDAGLSVLDSHSYDYDAVNQRTRHTGADSSYWLYGYDSRGQLTNASRHWATGTAVAGQHYSCQYDDIGNRRQSALSGLPADYSVNLLNQYTARTVPGVVWLTGVANSNATVTLNHRPVTRQGRYFAGSLPVINTSQAVYTQLVTVGVLGNVDPQNRDIVTSVTGHVYLAQSPESFEHDADGNLLRDGRWLYQWDAENRLIRIETAPPAVAAGSPRLKLELAYDHQNRRIAKKVFNWSADLWELVAEHSYVYDRGNLLAERSTLAASPLPLRTYAWGLDLSGTEQEAGGIGGLLWTSSNPGLETEISDLVAFDGNGNVAALMAATNTQLSAQFEYGPFGEIIRATFANPAVQQRLGRGGFRFSNRYQDAETGLLYYGQRYYQPATGRWLSRDPIWEKGDLNLYRANQNNSINLIDPIGTDVFVAYRPLAIGGLTKTFPLTGHAYLAFNDDHMDANWFQLKRSLGYRNDGWITFSYHPTSVQDRTGERDDLASVLVTAGSWVDVNNDAIDRVAMRDRTAYRFLITTDSCTQISLLRRAHASYLRQGDDTGPYSFLAHNCASWTKDMVEQAGARYPFTATLMNYGMGVDGMADAFQISRSAYVGALAGIGLRTAVSYAGDKISQTARWLAESLGRRRPHPTEPVAPHLSHRPNRPGSTTQEP